VISPWPGSAQSWPTSGSADELTPSLLGVLIRGPAQPRLARWAAAAPVQLPARASTARRARSAAHVRPHRRAGVHTAADGAGGAGCGLSATPRSAVDRSARHEEGNPVPNHSPSERSLSLAGLRFAALIAVAVGRARRAGAAESAAPALSDRPPFPNLPSACSTGGWAGTARPTASCSATCRSIPSSWPSWWRWDGATPRPGSRRRRGRSGRGSCARSRRWWRIEPRARARQAKRGRERHEAGGDQDSARARIARRCQRNPPRGPAT
jgi:hypothetical protein